MGRRASATGALARRRAVFCGAVAWLAVLVAGAQPALAAGQTATLQERVLKNQAIGEIGSMTLLGDTPASTPLIVGVSIQHPDPAGEEAAARAIYDPHSSSYHQFFTPAAWAARFGVPQSTYDRVIGRITSSGLRVVWSSATRDYVLLAGNVQQVDEVFKVTERQYRTGDGHVVRANAQPPTVPLEVNGVTGLSDLGNLLIRSHTQGDCLNGTCIGNVVAEDLWKVYDVPSITCTNSAGCTGTITGAGQKIAVIGSGAIGPIVPDLRQFESGHNFPQVPVVEHRVGFTTDPSGGNPGEGEFAMDSEASQGMAPNVAELDYYFSPTLGDPSAFKAWADDPNGPEQANASFGGCESLNLELGNVAADSVTFRQLAAEGRTQFVSTGDTGGSCTVLTGNGIANTVVPQVEWPAASRWVVAVGGTTVYTDATTGQRAMLPTGPAEHAWTHTGGGSSITQPEPDWQKTIPVVTGQCAFDETTGLPTAPTTCRGLPDVAAMSGDVLTNQYAIFDGSAGGNTTSGGTSLSSPLWMGMWALIQSAEPGLNHGFAAPALYTQGLGAKDASDFFDVSVGDNVQYPALPRNSADPTGWDYVSGLGAPDVTHLIADLPAGTPPQPAPTPSSSPSPGGTGGCQYAFRDTTPDAYLVAPFGPVPGEGQQDNLDIYEGDLGVTADGNSLRASLTIANLTPPPSGSVAQYQSYWTVDGTNYQATQVQLDSSGNATYSAGTLSFTSTGSTYTSNPALHATGSAGSGALARVEVDVPLADLQLAKGSVLKSPGGLAALITNFPPPADSQNTGLIVDQDPGVDQNGQPLSTGNPYTVGDATCLDAPPGGGVPEAPLALFIPALGAVVAGTWEVRRRRRRPLTDHVQQTQGDRT